MRKILLFLMAAILLLTIITCTALATDNGADDAVEAMDATAGEIREEGVVTTTYYDPEPAPEPKPGEPLTWAYLATIAGATAATLLIVQYFKAKLDKVWKIPTRVFVYVIALAILLLATSFTQGLTVENGVLTVINAFVVAAAAFGAYEVTFKKLE